MILAASLLAVVGASPWFGPVTVSFDAPIQGNPYDPDANDVWAEFRLGNSVERRPAFYEDGKWKAVLLSRFKGNYTARLVHNNKQLGSAEKFELITTSRTSFVRSNGKYGFALDDGTRYWPVGFNLGWQSPGLPDLADALRAMPNYGVNWARIWSCHWDGKNPLWNTAGSGVPAEELNPAAIKRWDQLIQAAGGKVKFQFVFFHHGPWSTNVNSNWGENPWNKANGGWLDTTNQFFTDPKAKKLSRAWIRYAIAKWGHDDSVMAWELFNEVEWCNETRDRPENVKKWHQEMYEYVNRMDEYKHLVTSSSAMELPIYGSADFYQPHGYPPSVGAMVSSAHRPDFKPFFYGEVGPADFNDLNAQKEAIRDGIFEAAFHSHSAAAMYWTWDNVYGKNLLGEWKTATQILNSVKHWNRDDWKSMNPTVESSRKSDLTLVPGLGWEAFRRYDYELPKDSNRFGEFSAYFQGAANAQLRTKPVTFAVDLDKPGEMTFTINETSGSGGSLKVSSNGKVLGEPSFDGGQKTESSWSVSLPAGRQILTIDNPGADWVRLSKLTLPNIGAVAKASGGTDGKVAMLRLRSATAGPIGEMTLTGLSLSDGKYSAQFTDLDTKQITAAQITIRGGKITNALNLLSNDVVLVLKKY